MEQPTFADLEYDGKKRKTRRERFLERMDGLIPPAPASFYPKAGRGRRPYDLSHSLCAVVLQSERPRMEDRSTASRSTVRGREAVWAAAGRDDDLELPTSDTHDLGAVC